jgi:DNA-binding Lrp family transcriptional regulator
MTHAFILVNCHFPFDARIREKVSAMQQVLAVYRTEGRHDLIVKVAAETEEALRDVVSSQIGKIQGVDATISLITKDPMPA